ncbi:hypothetical protein K1T71_013696 [Dendrolimus kikuchii]|uniref:Uncharacterized protein n=1 Tax=Dendrolimus kikuchii TaxID=765133 RepID=A0ACC1CH75_9NEOP|nr:hypothetical protein K1T71_013696 [Dendrolimus kikuchii]
MDLTLDFIRKVVFSLTNQFLFTFLIFERKSRVNLGMINLIDKFEHLTSHATESEIKAIIPAEDIEKLYNDMAECLDDIIELLRETKNIYKFIKDKGINRVIETNLQIKNTKLRIRFIVILKILFTKAPTSTKANIPHNIVDDLLDMFERDDNLAIKAHVLDVLNIWLPETPKIQARVMEIKGLEPFYDQVAKLDTNVIKTLLGLFNKILNEHLRERNTKIQSSKADLDKLRLYQKIGLIERMSTPTVCNGLLNIFEIMWNVSTDDNKAIFNVFELIKNVKPFCISIFRGKAKAKELFNKLSEYVNDQDNLHLLEKYLNLTDVNLVVSGYLREIRSGTMKDEF